MGSVFFRMLIEAYRKGTSISASKCCGKITTNLIYFPLGKDNETNKGFFSCIYIREYNPIYEHFIIEPSIQCCSRSCS